MNKSFEREMRYYVAKIRDVNAALNDRELETLFILLGKVDEHRTTSGKKSLEGVFVQDNWTIYSEVWQLVEHEFKMNEGK